jgi:hypothetical protein
MKTHDQVLAAMKAKLAEAMAKAMERVFLGTDWLTAAQVAASYDLKDSNFLFSIRRGDQDLYPSYAFADDGTPRPAIEEILQSFEGSSAERIASWFEEKSLFLGDMRPRELIATEPERVVLAAKDVLEQEKAQQARIEFMQQDSRKKAYFNLEIVATERGTKIWLCDVDGYLVTSMTGTLTIGLEPGIYTVEFGLGTQRYLIELNRDRHFKQSDCERDGPVATPLEVLRVLDLQLNQADYKAT